VRFVEQEQFVDDDGGQRIERLVGLERHFPLRFVPRPREDGRADGHRDRCGVHEQGDFATLESAMQNATANVPSQVKSDWQTIVTAYTKFVNAIKGINLADLTNPATAAQVQAAASEMNSPAVQQASDNINAWAKQNCS
jgi:hypothetical protein